MSNGDRLPVAILAGGLATRLRPLTETIPKSLIDIGGSPFIEHQLDLLRSHGIRDVVVCAGYLGNMIADAIGDGTDRGMRVQYSFDGERLLGTAGSLRNARELLGSAFFVLYGDSYLPCDYAAVQSAFVESSKYALMTVYRNEGRWDRSNVRIENGAILRYDKRHNDASMRHIDYGLGVLSQPALNMVPADEPSDLASLYQRLLESGQLAAFEVPERFYEIGSFEGLAELREYLQAHPATRA
jgi:N-acetyl-alpha-D-muramate 1-phosphate uridylyltransferase